MTGIPKPAHGSPCNSCGLCCQLELCPLAQRALPIRIVPCPALKKLGGRYTCDLAERPDAYRPDLAAQWGAQRMREAAMWVIGAGKGCDMRLPTEPYNHAWAKRTLRKADPRKLEEAVRVWGLVL